MGRAIFGRRCFSADRERYLYCKRRLRSTSLCIATSFELEEISAYEVYQKAWKNHLRTKVSREVFPDPLGPIRRKVGKVVEDEDR